ncbi:PA2169 family four-helix-bundle protein [Roseateles sp. DAIF2]|uniref:ferritin-like domain-containing protein n=1 Tax=Roseateles sp. DAIF2 TaxID=2714952 RepID=UPI0018A25A3B|nr:PA2169 family four-helix-bundle protein [Roseateles sp. DAIF2]QPF74141.1 PA2169 family four-helix-bundle protein [Roseateles sp. DAIF2]
MDSQDVIATLRQLSENCRDGEQGLGGCAARASHPQLRQLFERHAGERHQAAAELQAAIRALGGQPEPGGSVAGAALCGLPALQGMPGGDSDLALLEACERGGDLALARYRRALSQDLPPAVRVLLQRQCDGAQRSHDQVRTLRDQARAAQAI